MHGRLLIQQAYITEMTSSDERLLLNRWDDALYAQIADGNLEAQAECLRELARIYLNLGMPASAMTNIQLAIDHCDSCDKPDAKTICNSIYASILEKKGQHELAKELLESGRNHWRAKGHRKWTNFFECSLKELISYH
jgi:hypothetical protein